MWIMRVRVPSRPPMTKITYHPKELKAVLKEMETYESRAAKVILTAYYELLEKSKKEVQA